MADYPERVTARDVAVARRIVGAATFRKLAEQFGEDVTTVAITIHALGAEIELEMRPPSRSERALTKAVTRALAHKQMSYFDAMEAER